MFYLVLVLKADFIFTVGEKQASGFPLFAFVIKLHWRAPF